MKRIYNILLAFMAFASVSCVENKIETDIPAAGSGDEVQFGLTLPGLTRTIYGKEANGAFPIYWVNGDKVQIISPDCLAGRNDAEYKVSVNNAEQNFVTSLTPTGANGVQWGDKPAVFYSVYPSGDYTIADAGNTIQNLKINFSDDFEVDANGVITPRQADCLMFAKTDEEIEIGSPVNLTYSPIATAVMLTLNGPTEDTDPTILDRSTKIQSVKLIAPEGTAIAGNFNVTLQNEEPNKGKYVFTEWVKDAQTSNEITAQIFDKATGEFYDIPAGKSVTLSMFLAPIADLEIKANSANAKENWRIEVLVQSEITKSPEKEGEANVVTEAQKLFTKSLKFTEGSTTSLKPGMVHKLPPLPNLDVDPESGWNVEDWMVHIPRNVYLSEVSIPGSWNSLNPDFQGSATSIEMQYANGVRAFHIDTRWKSSNNPSDGIFGFGAVAPEGIELSVAVGGSGNTNSYGGGNLQKPSIPNFATYLKQITDKVQPDEYMVVICTFAQNSYNGDLRPSTWYKAVSDACAANTNVLDASKLTQNTLVGDVLNKVIVIVNMSEPITSTSSLPVNSKCLFTYMPMLLTADLFNGTDDNKDDIWISAESVTQSGLIMYNSQAQISSNGTTGYDKGDRGYAPTITERTNVLNKIIDWSKDNYGKEDYTHNQWLYLGLGGYQMTQYGTNAVSGSYLNIETTYNTWIYDRVTAMGKNGIPYYPVGIVLMNSVNSEVTSTENGSEVTYNNYANKQYGFDEVVKEILLLNNKYRLQYDPNKPSDYNPNATPQSAAASYSSGMKDSDVAAFGWD